MGLLLVSDHPARRRVYPGIRSAVRPMPAARRIRRRGSRPEEVNCVAPVAAACLLVNPPFRFDAWRAQLRLVNGVRMMASVLRVTWAGIMPPKSRVPKNHG